MRNVIYTDRFIRDVAAIYSERMLEQLDRTLAHIEQFPHMGSSNLRPSIMRAFGPGLRKLPMPPFIVVYRFIEEQDRLEFLALPYEKAIP